MIYKYLIYIYVQILNLFYEISELANIKLQFIRQDFMQIVSSVLNQTIPTNSVSIVNECFTTFCGCQTIKYNRDQDDEIQVSYKLYIYTLFTVVMIMGSIKLSMQWFIYKDYFPFKQKSPILSIIMIISICIQTIIYPIVYSVNYFTFEFTDPKVRGIFRAVQTSMEFSVYFIYLLRCLRTSYAHETHKSRRRSFAFRVFEKEYLLALSVVAVIILRAIPALLDFYIFFNSWNFAFGFELAVFSGDSQIIFQNYYAVRNLITNLLWQWGLIYCMWLHRKVNYRYSMQKQIALILGATQISNLLNISALWTTVHERSTLRYLCNISDSFPMTQFLKIVNLLIALVISLIYPLTQKKVYHVLLPSGPQYGFVKTMRSFLMQKQFLRIFTKYLQYLDQEQRTDYYTKLLTFWQKLIMFKLSAGKKTEKQKIQQISALLTQAQNDVLKDHSFLVSKLKETILGMQDSFISGELSLSREEEQEEVTNMNPSLITQLRRQKYRSSINQKTDQLEQICLQKLNKIYTDRYYFTKSFLELKKIMNEYKKVNLNLIMLDMALIVDSEQEYDNDYDS